jgi:hypothetical protein
MLSSAPAAVHSWAAALVLGSSCLPSLAPGKMPATSGCRRIPSYGRPVDRLRSSVATFRSGGYLRGCAKIEVALRDELSLSLRPRPAEFAAADRPHAKGPGPAVPTALDPVRGHLRALPLPGRYVFMQVDARVPWYGHSLDVRLAPLRADVGCIQIEAGSPGSGHSGLESADGDAALAVAFTAV